MTGVPDLEPSMPRHAVGLGVAIGCFLCVIMLFWVLAGEQAPPPLVGLVPILIGAVALIPSLGRPLRASLGAWCLLCIFGLGYLGKSLAFAVWLEPLAAQYYEVRWVRPDNIAAGLGVIGPAFLAYAAVALLVSLLYRPVADPPGGSQPGEVSARRLRLLLVGAVSIGFITTVLPLVLGFGAMGMEARPLPYRLDVPITRARMNLVPAALLLCIWLAERAGHRRELRWALIALPLVGLLDAFVRGSRGGLVMVLLPLFLLWLIEGTLRGRRLWLLGAAVLAYFAMYPILTALRVSRMFDMPLTETIARAAELADNGTSPLSRGFINALTRVSGAEAIWWLGNMRLDGWRWDLAGDLLRDRSLTQAYTWNVVGVIREGDWRPPTFIGAFLLIGGAGAVPWLTAIATGAIELVCRGCSRLQIAPVALALFGTFVFVYVSEGNFGVRDPIGLIVTLFLVTLLFRWLQGGYLSKGLISGSASTPHLRRISDALP